jgi:hypothetical protein
MNGKPISTLSLLPGAVLLKKPPQAEGDRFKDNNHPHPKIASKS